jgi:hypothetical protein
MMSFNIGTTLLAIALCSFGGMRCRRMMASASFSASSRGTLNPRPAFLTMSLGVLPEKTMDLAAAIYSNSFLALIPYRNTFALMQTGHGLSCSSLSAAFGVPF